MNNVFKFDNAIFGIYADAEKVLEKLNAIINEYAFVTVSDFYDLAGVTCRQYMADKYGWTDIRNAKIVRVRDGYMIRFRKPTLVKK